MEPQFSSIYFDDQEIFVSVPIVSSIPLMQF